MRRLGLVAALLAVNVYAAATTVCAETKVGEPAPEFSVTDTNGQPQSLTALRGSYVVLEWFNPECPFVEKHYGTGNMQDLQRRYTDRGVVWLSVDSSAPGKQGHLTVEQANAFMMEQKAAQTAIVLDPDGALGRAYGAKTTPHMFIVDPERTLIYAGAIDDIASADPADVADATNFVTMVLDPALSGDPVSVGETQSYGCSVKYQ